MPTIAMPFRHGDRRCDGHAQRERCQDSRPVAASLIPRQLTPIAGSGGSDPESAHRFRIECHAEYKDATAL